MDKTFAESLSPEGEQRHVVSPLTKPSEFDSVTSEEGPNSEREDKFQNDVNLEMSRMGAPIGSSTEKEEYYENNGVIVHRISSASITEGDAMWHEQHNIGKNTALQEESTERDADERSNSDSSHQSHATSGSTRLGCNYWLKRLIVRICRPHIRSTLCCLSSPRLPRCLRQIPPRKRQIICRSLIIIFMIITITFVCLDLIFLKRYLHSWLQSLLSFMGGNPGWGALVFVVMFVVASLCFFPVPLLSLGAGFVYIELYGLGVGICVSFLVCYIGYLCGAAICFARSRYLMRRLIVRFSEKYPVVRAVDRAFETMGFRIFLLLRLSPAMPFNALNYIGGITAIKFKAYCLSTSVGVIPGLIWTIFVGATFGTVGRRGVDGKQQLDEKSALNKGIVLGLGIGLGVMGLIGTGIYARRELTKIIIAEQQAREAEEQAALRFSSSIEEGAENPQSGIDEDNLSLATNEESASIARSLRGSFQSDGGLSLPIDGEDQLSLAQGTPARKRNWTADNIAAELPILPVVSPFFWRMVSSSETMGTDQNVEVCLEDNISNAESTGVMPKNRTQVLGGIDESRALSFRNQEGQDGFLQGDGYKPVSNRRRCGTDPYMYMPSQKQCLVLSNVAVEEKKGDVETTPRNRLVKLFQGDFPRFNRRRCNSDPNETEKRAVVIDATATLDVEMGSKSPRRSSSPLEVKRSRDDGDATERRVHRSASMNQLDFSEEVDREWFWLFA